MKNKNVDYLEWLHYMREEEKKERKNQPVELFLQDIKKNAQQMLKKNGLNLPVVKQTKMKLSLAK